MINHRCWERCPVLYSAAAVDLTPQLRNLRGVASLIRHNISSSFGWRAYMSTLLPKGAGKFPKTGKT